VYSSFGFSTFDFRLLSFFVRRIRHLAEKEDDFPAASFEERMEHFFEDAE